MMVRRSEKFEARYPAAQDIADFLKRFHRGEAVFVIGQFQAEQMFTERLRLTRREPAVDALRPRASPISDYAPTSTEPFKQCRVG